MLQMKRRRLVFYAILAIFLSIIVASLALEFVSEQFVFQLFVATTIFAIGIIALDFIGVLGGHESAHGDEVGDLHFGGDVHDFDVSLDDGGQGLDDAGLDLDGDAGDLDGDHGAIHDHVNGHASPVLSILAYLRMFVYFCLGFGPAGWVAMATGRGALVALIVGSAVGVIATLAAQSIFRFQRSTTDSSLAQKELQFQEATVIVPLSHDTMGKVRTKIGMAVTERYALAARADARFGRGETVRIVRLGEDCVYVDR